LFPICLSQIFLSNFHCTLHDHITISDGAIETRGKRNRKLSPSAYQGAMYTGLLIHRTLKKTSKHPGFDNLELSSNYSFLNSLSHFSNKISVIGRRRNANLCQLMPVDAANKYRNN
jgi:hypothetical protein